MNSNFVKMKNTFYVSLNCLTMGAKKTLLILHLHCFLYLIRNVKCDSYDQAELDFEPLHVTTRENMDTNDFCFNIESLTKKQCNFIYFLCSTIANDIKSHAISSIISNTFKKTYEKINGNSYKPKTGKSNISSCDELDNDIKQELKIYFGSCNTLFNEKIINKHIEIVINEIKNINKNLVLLDDIISSIKNRNKKNRSKTTTAFKVFNKAGIKYIEKLSNFNTLQVPEIVKDIEGAKALYPKDFEKFEKRATEIFKKYYGNIWHLIVKYEKELVMAKFNNCISKMKTLFEYWYPAGIQQCFKIMFFEEFNISILSEPEQIKFVAEKLNVKCKINSEINMREYVMIQHISDFEKYEETFKNGSESLSIKIDILKKNLNDSTKKTRSCLMLPNFTNIKTHRKKANEINEQMTSENIIFTNNLKTLFKLNMRGLIFLKIVVNAIEYFIIYHYSYLHINNLPELKELNYENLIYFKKKIKGAENLIIRSNSEELNEKEKLFKIYYQLYLDYKNTCYTSKTKFFNHLNAIVENFKKIENKILRFCCSFLSENYENNDFILDTLMLVYEEEYTKMASIINNDLKYKFIVIPTKLEKYLNKN